MPYPMAACRGRTSSLGDSGPPVPVADFSADDTTVASGAPVTFTDLSTNTPDEWTWEKNDGSGWGGFDSGTLDQNPVETFEVGTWSIRLTAANAFGNDAEEKTDYITVSNVLLTSLVAYWALDDEDKADATDALGPNTATCVNDVGVAEGIITSARDFNGTNQRFTLDDNADVSIGDIDVTFAVWVYLDAKGGDKTIFAKDDESGVGREYDLLFDNGEDRFVFQVSGNGSSMTRVKADNLGSPSVETWYFIVVRHSASGNVIGIQVNNGTENTIAHTTGIIDGTAPFLIGCGMVTAVPWKFWNGRIEALGMWKRSLSAAERTYLYAGRTFAEFS